MSRLPPAAVGVGIFEQKQGRWKSSHMVYEEIMLQLRQSNLATPTHISEELPTMPNCKLKAFWYRE